MLESEVIKLLVLCLLDPEESVIPEPQIIKALNAVESWMVRRMLVRAITKAYNQAVAELIIKIRSNRHNAGDTVESFLASQSTDSRYWPDDEEVRQELGTLMAYRRLQRGRLRMALEAIEDHVRGWKNGQQALGGERVARGKLGIEHVMPRKWQTHWALENHGQHEAGREALIHTIGNLTLLTGRLNSKVANGPWQGNGGKREAIKAHDVLLLNRRVLTIADTRGQWSDDAVQERTQEMIEAIIEIWPVPHGHRSGFGREKLHRQRQKKVALADIMSAGLLSPGMLLYPRQEKFSDKITTLLPDGRLELDGVVYESLSSAAVSIVGRPMNGWWFFLTDPESRRSLRMVRGDYVDAMAEDGEDDEDDDDEE